MEKEMREKRAVERKNKETQEEIKREKRKRKNDRKTMKKTYEDLCAVPATSVTELARSISFVKQLIKYIDTNAFCNMAKSVSFVK